MSSRNHYLSRRRAAASAGAESDAAAHRSAHRRWSGRLARLIDAGLTVLAEEPEIRLDYLRIVDPETLEDVPDVSAGALVAVAAVVGPARLIDNVLIAPR